MPTAANPTRSPLRNLGAWALHTAAWFAWLTLSVVLLGFILTSIGSPLERSAVVIGVAAAAAVLILSGALGAVWARRLPDVRTAPYGPSGIALLVGLGGAQLRFASFATEAALDGLGTLLPAWLVIAGAVLLGELAAVRLLRRRARAD